MTPFFLREWDCLLPAAVTLLLFAGIHHWLWRRRQNGAIPLLTRGLVATLLGTGWFFMDGPAQRTRERLQQMVEGYAPTDAQELARLGRGGLSLETAADEGDVGDLINTRLMWRWVFPVAPAMA